MKTTKLSEKLRRLARQKPDIAPMCHKHANLMDMASMAYGDQFFSKNSNIYRNARTFYCRVMGRDYEWGAASDLELVERDDRD